MGSETQKSSECDNDGDCHIHILAIIFHPVALVDMPFSRLRGAITEFKKYFAVTFLGACDLGGMQSKLRLFKKFVLIIN